MQQRIAELERENAALREAIQKRDTVQNQLVDNAKMIAKPVRPKKQ